MLLARRVDLAEFWVHIQVRTWLEAVLKRKYSELKCISSTGVHRPNIYLCSTLSLHISYCFLFSSKGIKSKKTISIPYSSGWIQNQIQYIRNTLLLWQYSSGIVNILPGYLQNVENHAKAVPLC